KGLLDPKDVDAVEARLFAALLHHADLAEASWTFGRATGDDADGDVELAPGSRGQIAVERTRDGRLITPYRHEEAGGWVMDARPRTPGGGFASADRFRTHFVPVDPTEHPTFTTPASARFRGMPLWSDLAFSPLDDALPENLRRKEMTVQKALVDAGGVFAGVLRAGLDAEAIERAGQRKASSAVDDPHRTFPC